MPVAKRAQKPKVKKAQLKKAPSRTVKDDGLQKLCSRQVLERLPSLYFYTNGRAFGAEALQSWSRREKCFVLPSVDEAEDLLTNVAQQSSSSSSSTSSTDSESGRREGLERKGVVWRDPEAEATVNNVRGGICEKHGTSLRYSWNEYTFIYQLRQLSTTPRPSYVVTETHIGQQPLGAVMTKSTINVKAGDKKASFKNVVVFDPLAFDPLTGKLGETDAQWSLIYLHSFSNKGTDYADFPHYFGIGDASVRVVCPTAPLLEQSCFPEWYVWKGEKLKWRRIKFNAWFDYVTDRGGRAENKINQESLLDMRSRLHGLIREEVQRIGDPKRVLVGGASQGCCVALDAALTYPEELGGVVGLVGHVLSATPLDLAKERASMPIHLFQEATDGEMHWRWVKDVIDRVSAAGFNVTAKRELDPSGAGHWIQEIEGQWICSALREIVTGAAKKVEVSSLMRP